MAPFLRMVAIALTFAAITYGLVWGYLRIREMRHERKMYEQKKADAIWADGDPDTIDDEFVDEELDDVMEER